MIVQHPQLMCTASYIRIYVSLNLNLHGIVCCHGKMAAFFPAVHFHLERKCYMIIAHSSSRVKISFRQNKQRKNR
ncbi:MAG: hypothetical protein AMS27_02555 [Bacteroides sp. SM23_62_1]|nr:MAG: hypothetical protein AMS27_02555 [Bacteroides sp. SM23_62_1]